MQVIIHPTVGVVVREDGRALNPRGRGIWSTGTVTNNGYLTICYKGKNYLMHRLVAQAFISNTESKEFVDHINRNRLDNRVCNLRWVTRKENNENQVSVDRAIEKWGYRPKDNRRRYGVDWARANRRRNVV